MLLDHVCSGVLDFKACFYLWDVNKILRINLQTAITGESQLNEWLDCSQMGRLSVFSSSLFDSVAFGTPGWNRVCHSNQKGNCIWWKEMKGGLCHAALHIDILSVHGWNTQGCGHGDKQEMSTLSECQVQAVKGSESQWWSRWSQWSRERGRAEGTKRRCI